MLKILLVYATNSGGTYVVGELVKDILSKDFSVTMQEASETGLHDADNYDVIILGSPTWDFDGKEGMPHEMMMELLNKWQQGSFAGKHFAVYGCGDKMFVEFCAAVDYMEKFAVSVGGRLILPSLRLNNFFFELEKNTELTKQWASELRKKLSV